MEINRIDKQKEVLHNLGNIFKINIFLTGSPKAVFRIQSKVYGGAFCKNHEF